MGRDESATRTVYAALGDSISIDLYAGGPGRGAASLLVRNQNDDFPEWRGRDLQSHVGDLELHLLAVDGGTCPDLLERQLPRLAALDVAPSVVTVTVGGNDVLGHYGNTRAALRTVQDVASAVDEVLGRLGAVTAPRSRIVVGTVYDPSDGTADAARVGLPPWPEVVEVLDALNGALRRVARARGARVAEIHDHFLGHGLTRGDPAQRQARPADRELWYCDVIEPNAWGAGAVRAAFWDAVQPL